MSASEAAGRPFSKYIDENILTPLISRLDFMLTDDRLRASDPDGGSDYDAFLKDVGGITRLMRGLQPLFGKIGEEEQVLTELFNPVEKLIDDVFESAAASKPQIREIRRTLDAVRKEVVGIRETIVGPYRIEEDSAGGGQKEDEDIAPMAATEWIRAIHDSEEMTHLRRAVNAMDPSLKHCILCLAAFPEGALIKKRLLIHWWIGEGFVISVKNGKDRFQQLVDLKFVRAIPRVKGSMDPYCRMAHLCTVHPLIRRMLVSVAKSAAFLEIDSEGNSSNDFERTRRACLRKGKMMLSGSVFQPKVSTIYNVDQSYVKLSTGWFTKKTCLGTLQLGQWRVFDPSKMAADAKKFHVELINEEHLNGIAACKSLRYLSLRGISRITAIPDAVGNLSELIILDLRACHNLQVLTKEITKLHKLQYLDCSECYLLVKMPEGLGKMSQLQVLKGFVIASSGRKNAGRLSELVLLNKMRKLSISIGRKVKPGEDDFKILAKLDSLKSLRITWGMISSKEAITDHNMEFSLPCNLVKLDLQCFPFKKFPELFIPVLKRVEKLYVTGGMLQSLEPLCQDRDCKLEWLRLRFLQHLPDHYCQKLEDIYTVVDDLHPKGKLWRKDEANISASVPSQVTEPDVPSEIVEEEPE